MQGSYRNMNRLAEKVLPMMNEQELMDLVLDHYKGESQKHTTGPEANILMYKQLIGVKREEEAARRQGVGELEAANICAVLGPAGGARGGARRSTTATRSPTRRGSARSR